MLLCSHWRIFHGFATVKAFRLGQESQGGGATVNFMDCLASLLEANSKMFAQDEVEFLDEIFAAQQRGDYIFVADLLGYIFPNTTL